MELLIGFLILFGMFLINQFLNKKLEDQNNSVNAGKPHLVLFDFDQMLKNLQLSAREVQLAKNSNLFHKYCAEIVDLCKVAQLYAIDVNVNSLEFRGEFFKQFRKKQSIDFQAKYDLYKEEFTSRGHVTSTFLNLMNLKDADVLKIDVSYADKWMANIISKSTEILKKSGFN